MVETMFICFHGSSTVVFADSVLSKCGAESNWVIISVPTLCRVLSAWHSAADCPGTRGQNS